MLVIYTFSLWRGPLWVSIVPIWFFAQFKYNSFLFAVQLFCCNYLTTSTFILWRANQVVSSCPHWTYLQNLMKTGILVSQVMYCTPLIPISPQRAMAEHSLPRSQRSMVELVHQVEFLPLDLARGGRLEGYQVLQAQLSADFVRAWHCSANAYGISGVAR